MSGDHKMGHVQPMKNYVFTFLALLTLTVITVWVSRITPSLVVAMGVASCKALLVALFFMHGKYEGKDVWSFIVYPFAILAILLLFVFVDYFTGATRTDKENYIVKPVSIVERSHHGDDHSGETHGAAVDHDAAGDAHGDASGDHGDGQDASGEKKDDHSAEGGDDSAKEGGDDHGNEGDH